MQTVLLGNNRLGVAVATYLAGRGELAAVVLHPEPKRAHGTEFAALGVPSWVWPDGEEAVRALGPECLLSVLFGFIVPDVWLAIPSWRALNLHPALLPFNRGSAPNVWPLVDGSPAGTTLHEMTAGLDRGGILVQEEVATRADDTAETLYRRLEDASLAMFTDAWPSLREREPAPQSGVGSYHRMADLATLDLTSSADLAVLDRLRARTFPPHGAEFERDGTRWRVRVEIEAIEDRPAPQR